MSTTKTKKSPISFQLNEDGGTSKTGGAGGTWTHTIYGRQILSLLRLPFRHNPVAK